MDQTAALDEEEIKYKFQSMIRSEHATYAAIQRPRYEQLTRRIEQLVAHKLKKESGDYRLLKRYEVRTLNGEKRLMKKGTVKMFVCTDELYDIIKKVHSGTKRKGESKIVRELVKDYANITRDQVKSFLQLCPCNLCVPAKSQIAKTPKRDLDYVSEAEERECSSSLPSDAELLSLNSSSETFAKEENLPNEANVQTCVAATSNGEIANSFVEKTLVSNIDAVSMHRKRKRLSHAESLDALKQCETLMKEEDINLEFNEALNVVNLSPSPSNLINGHHPYTGGGDTLTEEPINAESIGACLQQLAECQRQLLYVESRRLAIEEVRLQVDQQVAASLVEIINHFKQNNDKTSI